MLSKKLTFSLTSLVILIMLSFTFTPQVLGADADNTTDDANGSFNVSIAIDEAVQDVSSDDGIQIPSSRDRENRDIENLTEDDVAAGAGRVVLLISFEKVVQLQILDPDTLQAAADALAETAADDRVDTSDLESGDDFGADDIIVDAYDNEGRALGSITLLEALINLAAAGEAEINEAVAIIKHKNPGGRIPGELPGREFVVQLDQQELENVYQGNAGRGGGFRPEAGLEIHTLLFSISKNTVTSAERGEVAAFRADTHKHLHRNKVSNVLQVDLVDDDEGDANYSRIIGTTATPVGDTGTPGVVAITTDSQIVRGAFYVEVLLTEQPMGNTFSLTIDDDRATAGAPEWLYAIEAAELVDDDAGTALIGGSYAEGNKWEPDAESEDTVTGTYLTGNYTEVTVDNQGGGEGGSIPQATGRDNMYHLYRVLVTPASGHNGPITISVAQFDDKVLPIPRVYLPLSIQQRRAITLPDAAEVARDARIRNTREVTTVTSRGIAAVDIYEANQDIFDANPNLKSLPAKLIIPAGGYLVLARGKTDSDPISGVANVSEKTKDRKNAAQQLYNVVYDFGLPFPADDLSSFFRSGGTLSLIYQDIPAATGSGHADSKGPTGDDATGYTAASTNAYAAGAVIINEIMWGLDANSPNGQYIELHNTTAAAIGIDSKEWAIAVGGTPAGFTPIDTVSNNPASGGWNVPGSSGATQITQETPVLSDLVSMSRVTGAADGTAAASWAASILPSVNISGRRIGTPGAANTYDTSAQDAAKAEAAAEEQAKLDAAAASKAPVATAGDLMITEIMVASNDGRLPQWIELANVSGAAVSLNGWSIDIDNDPADDDVVNEAVNVELGDVTVGADQTVLVVTKSTERSSVGTGEGNIREDRIVDVQSQVSAANARYSLISETAFRLSLLPPREGGIVERGDVVGNLGMGWELPMSEGDRSSIIRREMSSAGEIMGTDAAGWVLASETDLNGAYVETYYGDSDDVGTPGYDAGGALPVELSSFSAARDRVTGQVVITWETQSELNNAGFFIKRSQQPNGQFVVVNPTMIPGAGTVSEKQSYTYTDTTAKPNIVYYYQIEDVSLDGNRQTLTRGHRLKGHIGAAGKATTTWGELKTSLDQ